MVRKGLPDADVFAEECPSRKVLDLVADKWAALLIYALAGGTHRYSDLVRRIHGVSPKMLTQTLRNLERDGLVSRKVYAVVPPRTEYALTPLGRSLLAPLASLCAWAEAHWPEVNAARRTGDGAGKTLRGRSTSASE